MSKSHLDVDSQHSKRIVHQSITETGECFASIISHVNSGRKMTCLIKASIEEPRELQGTILRSTYGTTEFRKRMKAFPVGHTTNTWDTTNCETFESKTADDTSAINHHRSSRYLNCKSQLENNYDCMEFLNNHALTRAKSEFLENNFSVYEKGFVNGCNKWHEIQNSYGENILMIDGKTNEPSHPPETGLKRSHSFQSMDEVDNRIRFEVDITLQDSVCDERNSDAILRQHEQSLVHLLSEVNYTSEFNSKTASVASCSDCSEVGFENQSPNGLRMRHKNEGYYYQQLSNVSEKKTLSPLDAEYGSDSDLDSTTHSENNDRESFSLQPSTNYLPMHNIMSENTSHITLDRRLESFHSCQFIESTDPRKNFVIDASTELTNVLQQDLQQKVAHKVNHEFFCLEQRNLTANKDLSNLLNLAEFRQEEHNQFADDQDILHNNTLDTLDSSVGHKTVSTKLSTNKGSTKLQPYETHNFPLNESRIKFGSTLIKKQLVTKRKQQYHDEKRSEILPNSQKKRRLAKLNACTSNNVIASDTPNIMMSLKKKIDNTRSIEEKSSLAHLFSSHQSGRRSHPVGEHVHDAQQIRDRGYQNTRRDQVRVVNETDSVRKHNKELIIPCIHKENHESISNNSGHTCASNRTQSLPQEGGLKNDFVVDSKLGSPVLQNKAAVCLDVSSTAHHKHISTSEKGQTCSLDTNPSKEQSMFSDETAVTSEFWKRVLGESELVKPSHLGLVSDAVIFGMAQMKLCGLTVDDRIGKYKNRELGFPGLCCVHCGGQPGFGRYFPGSFDSFLNGTNCESIVAHVKNGCRSCPEHIRSAILKLHREEQMKQNRPAHGSRRQFFESIWCKLSSYKAPQDSSFSSGGGKVIKTKPSPTLLRTESCESDHKPIDTMDSSERTNEVFTEEHWNLLIGNSELVGSKDRHLVEDALLISFAQMIRCRLDDADRVGRTAKAREEGCMGMCCKHCIGQLGDTRHGRYFPSSLRSLSQIDMCQKIVRHIATACIFVPTYVRLAAQKAIEFEKSRKRKYGSRILFYRRVWRRLHMQDVTDGALTLPNVHNQKNILQSQAMDDASIWDRVIGDSSLVTLSDRHLVSLSELAAIAQMVPCMLTPEEQVGWFKDRPVGWGGLACKHCGGRPSNGKYFPKSSKTFAQTTCGQTILSHITIFCKSVPEDIKAAVEKFQRIEASDKGTSSVGARDHGSRKAFYDRIWKIIHSQNSTMSLPKDNTESAATESNQQQLLRIQKDNEFFQPTKVDKKVKSIGPKDPVPTPNLTKSL